VQELALPAARSGRITVTSRVGDGKAVDARSMLSVLSLGAKQGTEVTLEAAGERADEALDTLADLLALDLGARESGQRTTRTDESRPSTAGQSERTVSGSETYSADGRSRPVSTTSSTTSSDFAS
jgi:phosphotransferase system HPr (HPr) family protein